MTPDIAIDIARQALWIIILVSSPMLLVSMVVGLIISIFQTITSIQEQTLTFVPKLIAIFIVMMLCGSWILKTTADYMIELYSSFSQYIR
ncbi:flagellar biosynthetic protein FliQ [Mobilisporobacter senegalensis]|uniref:Flagellar biosynthetic protein FliQ n=1 Tax=Mobilisporobacter senegalensis TaxID=1329262 RepID=A0A3N1XVZ0_9FIRM|nr:flagellar biosynthesis protein FliQ [Mobilisporobacter senegalensis]ROR30780.1 flagellar biosynthetic protein FliQ [Mobilisporobacter senegalensis]